MESPRNIRGVDRFRAKFGGQLILPGEESYEEARKVWNGMIDRHPAIVARCSNTADVMLAVDFARENGLLVAVRGGGHNVAGFGTCDDGLVIDLSLMKAIQVDPKSRIARAQPGLTWGEFDRATQSHGLATPGGLVSSTGIAGFTLGGGIGWLLHKYGMTIDNLISAEVVKADGEVVMASESQNADLFWGIRGGGGNFGIVTSFEYRLHPVGPNVFAGALMYDAVKAGEILDFYAKWAPSTPDELTTMAEFATVPIDPSVPQDMQGRKTLAIAMCYVGSSAEEGRKAVKPLYDFSKPDIDLLGEIPYVQFQSMFDALVPKGIRSYWKTAYIAELSREAIEAFTRAATGLPTPSSAIDIHHVKGAPSRIAPGQAAFSHRDTPYIVNIIGLWKEQNEDRTGIDWVRATWNSLQPFSTGATYVNFMSSEAEDQVRAAYGPEKYVKLSALKRKYDPSNLFRVNQNIKPA
jgi:FAD/FMN-containing dehydrogenase